MPGGCCLGLSSSLCVRCGFGVCLFYFADRLFSPCTLPSRLSRLFAAVARGEKCRGACPLLVQLYGGGFLCTMVDVSVGTFDYCCEHPNGRYVAGHSGTWYNTILGGVRSLCWFVSGKNLECDDLLLFIDDSPPPPLHSPDAAFGISPNSSRGGD